MQSHYTPNPKATIENNLVILKTVTGQQIFNALSQSATGATFDEIHQGMSKVFLEIRFLLKLNSRNKPELTTLANHCVAMLAAPKFIGQMDALIRRGKKENAHKKPSILEDYFELLKELRAAGARQQVILELLVKHIPNIEDIDRFDLAWLFTMLTTFDPESHDYTFIFNALKEQADRHPRASLSKFIAESLISGENDSFVIETYFKMLEVLAQMQNFQMDDKLNLFHYADGSKQKLFYNKLKLNDGKHAQLAHKCDMLLAGLLMTKFSEYELPPHLKHLLAHKEKVTTFILNMDERPKIETINKIINQRDTPISKYFWAARSLRSPSLERGELKKLNLELHGPRVEIISGLPAAVVVTDTKASKQGIFSRKNKAVTVSQDEVMARCNNSL